MNFGVRPGQIMKLPCLMAEMNVLGVEINAAP